MKLLYDDDLVEGVVRGCAEGQGRRVAALQVRRFHAERERCYRVLDPDERAAAFARVQWAWFAEWGWEEDLSRVAGRFGGLSSALVALAFRKARGRSEEGAEMYGDAEGNRRGMVTIRPERFGDEAGLEPWLHHELAHVADMVDPEFGYEPGFGVVGQTVSQQRLTRERYRLLWAVSIDGRLRGRGLSTVADEGQRRGEFERGFGFLPADRRAQVFGALWGGEMARHAALAALAADPRGLRGQRSPLPGAACPLCGFAAFAWTKAEGLRKEAVARMRREFPHWEEEDPVCARCAEMYDAITGMVYPATVCL